MASLSFTLFNVVDDLFGRPILLAGIIMDLLPDLKMCENNHETTNRVQWHKYQQTKAKLEAKREFIDMNIQLSSLHCCDNKHRWRGHPDSGPQCPLMIHCQKHPRSKIFMLLLSFFSAQITLEYCQIYCWGFCITVHKKMLQKAHLASLSAFANSAAEMKTILTRLVNNQASQRIATLRYIPDLLTFSSVWL